MRPATLNAESIIQAVPGSGIGFNGASHHIIESQSAINIVQVDRKGEHVDYIAV